MKHSLSKLSIAVSALMLLAGCAEPHAPQAAKKPFGKPPPLAAQPRQEPPKGMIPSSVPAMKVALLVPLSGDSAAVGNAMLDAATMALSDSYLATPSDRIRSQVILLPKDTGNTPADSAKAVQQALDQGATFVIGPLFSQSVSVVAPLIRQRNVNLLSFSNNRAVAGNGVFVFGFLPEQQVLRMAEYAYLHNYQRVAILAPNDSYGQKVRDTLVEAYTQKGGIAAPAELYAPSASNIDAAVARLVGANNNAAEERRFQAIFIADGGYQLKNVIESLKKHHVDLTKIKLIGTGLWDDPEILKIPEMNGAWFPSSPPDQYRIFERHFVATYGYKPVRLASLAYDAVDFVVHLSMPTAATPITASALTNPQGLNSPANGLFRLRPDGTSERKLAVMEVTPNGFKVIDPALKGF